MSSIPKKFKPEVITEKTKQSIIKGLPRIIEMYEDVSKGHIVTEWECFCDIIPDSQSCRACPLRLCDGDCIGPGGNWIMVRELIYIYHMPRYRHKREIIFDKKFEVFLKRILENTNWDDNFLTDKQIRRKVRYWTVDKIMARAKKKAEAWKKWLKWFKKQPLTQEEEY